MKHNHIFIANDTRIGCQLCPFELKSPNKQDSIKDVLDYIESKFLDTRHSQYRHEISKKSWSKIKKKYEFEGR